MNDLVIPDEGCNLITIEWLNNLSVAFLHTEDAFHEFISINELPVDTDLWYTQNGATLNITHNDVTHYVLFCSELSIRTIIHECTHIIDYIFRDVGIPISEENGETRAYMVEFMCMKIFDIIGMPIPHCNEDGHWANLETEILKEEV